MKLRYLEAKCCSEVFCDGHRTEACEGTGSLKTVTDKLVDNRHGCRGEME